MKPLHTFIIFCTLAILSASCGREETMFVRLMPGKTGVDFSNRITESESYNIMRFEYVYNGGGVAVGDFNNDGFQDLFFTGNLVNNELYLNRGNFRFQKVSEIAGIEGADRWCSGVAAVDINNDGWLDLYVCATSFDPAERRANLLYINQGVNADNIPVFREMAEEYGVADTTHTTTAAFFDYDNDGDLDLFLLVNHFYPGVRPNTYMKDGDERLTINADRLYENRHDSVKGHPVFRNVSAEAGFNIGGFGLGMNILDINRDGWKDIYVSNDYLSRDQLWMNNGDGTFTDRASVYMKHTPYSAMGMNTGDVNNDGLTDIFVLDMCPEYNGRRKTMLQANDYNSYTSNESYGYPYQYVRNMLQLNLGNRPDNGELIFSETGLYAGIYATDWSWSPLIADFDLDGFRDLLISNGFPKDITDHDFNDYMASIRNVISDELSLMRIPSVKLHNYAYRNELDTPGGIPSFVNVTEQWGIGEPSFSSGAVYADLDNDGDLDYIVNNIDDSAFIYRNTILEQELENTSWMNITFKGTVANVNGIGAIAEIYHDGQRQMWENTPYRGYQSSVQMGAHFGLGEAAVLDSVRIEWPGGNIQVLYDVPVNQNLVVQAVDASPGHRSEKVVSAMIFNEISKEAGVDYTHPEYDYIDYNVQRLLLHKLSQFGPGLAVSDINGDGLEDFYVGGSHFNKGRFFVQQPDGTFRVQDLLPGEEGESKGEEELGVLFFDADNDGDEDLYLVSGGYEFDISDSSYRDRLFRNENGEFVQDRVALPEFLSSGSCVRAADFDRDGDLDLFVGGRVLPHYYPLPVSSHLLINDGNGVFSHGNEEYAPYLDSIGLISDALWTDYDNDGWVDLILAGEWMSLIILKNESGKLGSPLTIGGGKAVGWWNSLASGDFDMDGDMDYVAGNLGTNSLIRTGEKHPVRIFAGDYDNNRTLDIIPTNYYLSEDGVLREYPYFGRKDMERQISQFKKIFKEHREFGEATIEEVMATLPDATELVLEANYQLTSWIENRGNGEFVVHPLPVEAQLAPVFAILTGDFNGDALPDILLTGNDFGNEVGTGRYDALNGLLLAGDGRGNFEPVPMQRSGIIIPGDGKSLVKLFGSDSSLVVVSGQNRGKLGLFRHAYDTPSIAPGRLDHAAIVHLPDNRSYREEIHYGHSFLSQSTRRFWFPPQAKKIEIIDYLGNTRIVHGTGQ